MKICAECKKNFSVPKHRINKAIFCSYKCYWDSGRKTIFCGICKKEFVCKKKSLNRKVCSIKCRGAYMKIHAYWRGKHISEETKKLISLTQKGKRNSPRTEFKKGNRNWSEGKKRPEISGSLHHNWKGGITKQSNAIRQTLEYKMWRKAIFTRDGYACVMCGAKSGKNKKVYLHADHIKPFAYYPELRFTLGNGRTLCIDCHSKTPTYKTGSLSRNKKGQFQTLI